MELKRQKSQLDEEFRSLAKKTEMDLDIVRKQHQFTENDDQEKEDSSSDSDSDSESSSSSSNRDESQSEYKKGGYHPACIGDKYNDRYIIEKKLGFGYFSTVWLASDQTRSDDDPHKIVAIKISKSRESFQEAAKEEMKFLQTLHQHLFTVGLLDQFIIYGPNGKHYCLVFEPMWKDLYYLIRKFNHKGFPIRLIKVLAYQILCGVEYMHQQKIIHTDIKPENFLLSLPFDLNYQQLREERLKYMDLKQTARDVERMTSAQSLNRNQRKRLKEKLQQHPELTKVDLNEIYDKMQSLEKMKMPTELNRSKNLIIKVADFGNACWINKHYTSSITTRQYRSPEALLGYPYSTPVDIFSCGIVFYEMATGDLLFQPSRGPGSDPYFRNENHLALMYRTLGHLPRHMIKEGKFARHYFNRRCEFRRHSLDGLESRRLEDLLKHKNYNEEDLPLFCDLLYKMLDPDPAKRITAAEARLHPWLADVHASYMQQNTNAFSLQ
jgi:serine/threonine-protein kinase SRPK3